MPESDIWLIFTPSLIIRLTVDNYYIPFVGPEDNYSAREKAPWLKVRLGVKSGVHGLVGTLYNILGPWRSVLYCIILYTEHLLLECHANELFRKHVILAMYLVFSLLLFSSGLVFQGSNINTHVNIGDNILESIKAKNRWIVRYFRGAAKKLFSMLSNH